MAQIVLIRDYIICGVSMHICSSEILKYIHNINTSRCKLCKIHRIEGVVYLHNETAIRGGTVLYVNNSYCVMFIRVLGGN